MNSPIRQLREALKPFTDNGPGGKYRTRPEDFDTAKTAYEATAGADDGFDWRQRAVDAEEMLREVLKDYDKRLGAVPAQPFHKQLVRFVDSLDAPPAAAGAQAQSISCSEGESGVLPEEVPSTDELVRRCWRAAGGTFYGPNVETGTMPEAKLLPYLRGLYQQIFDLREQHAAPQASSPAPALEQEEWTPQQALEFYAAGRHFDVVDGRTRILDTGAIASDALKQLSTEYAQLKGLETPPAAGSGVEPWQVPLWDAINRYVCACRGDPSKHVYGNTPRQTAVAEISDIVRGASQPASGEPVAYRKFLDPQYDYSDRYRYRDATSIGAPAGWEPLYAVPPGVARRIETLFAALAHGDEEHRTWLAQAIADHFAGRAVGHPRGKGNDQSPSAGSLTESQLAAVFEHIGGEDDPKSAARNVFEVAASLAATKPAEGV